MNNRSKLDQKEVYCCNEGEVPKPNECFIKCRLTGLPPNQMMKRIQVAPIQSISEIKKKITSAYELKSFRLQLIFRGAVLDNNLKLYELDFRPETDIFTVMILIDGG